MLRKSQSFILSPQPRAPDIHLKRVRFLPLLLLPFSALPALAQQRYEGTLTQTQSGLTARAQIYAQSPDLLRVEIARDDAAGVAAQIIVASGDQTLRYEPATKRLFRARFNILKKWNRDWRLAAGGPANFVFAGASAGITEESEGRFLRRDKVLFGGGGENAYYAAVKIPASAYPARVEISGAPLNKRVETALDGMQSLNAILTYNGALPGKVEVVAAGETSVFNYDLKARAEPFADSLWTIDDAKGAIAEETDLRAPSAYPDAKSPADLLNGGIALWRGAGDFPAAQTRFVSAANLAPTATAPILASFEMALDARDFTAAARALDALAPLGLDAAEIEARRARLALAGRDWDGALAALDKAIASAPASSALQLGRAQALLGKGDIEGARAIWTKLTAAPTAPATRADAFSLLATSIAPDETDLLQSVSETAANSSPDVSPAEKAARALFLERAGNDAAARAIWADLEKSAPLGLQNQASAHLMVLAAREGDVAASLAAYNRLLAALNLQSDRDTATQALFGAWQKAFKRDQLGAAIANRAVATNATDADARLALAYQDSFGDSDSINAAINSGLARSPEGALWLSRQAETLVDTAFPMLTSNSASAARRTQLLNQARALLERAIASDVKAGGNGLFYRQQLTLISSQSSAKTALASDTDVVLGERKIANAAVDKLLASAPDDPDVTLSAALGLQSFDPNKGAARVIELANRALNSNPDDGPRHTLILAARQAMAFAYAREKQFPDAAAQFELLLLESQTAGEQVGIASNYIGMLEKTGDAGAPQAAARIAAGIAGAPWDYADARAALEALAPRVAISPMVANIELALQANDAGASKLAWAQIAQARLARANAALQVPNAPGSADADLVRATRDSNAAIAALKAVPEAAMPRWVSARVAAWLAEFGGLEPQAALADLQSAVAIESRAPSLRVALADATPDDEAAKQLKLAGQLAATSPEIARILSVAALDMGDAETALARSDAAYNQAAREPNVNANTFQRIAFARARILWEADQKTAAQSIYSGLALPQWNDTDRAAALLALRARYTAAGQQADADRVGEQVRALGLDLETLQRAAGFVEDVED